MMIQREYRSIEAERGGELPERLDDARDDPRARDDRCCAEEQGNAGLHAGRQVRGLHGDRGHPVRVPRGQVLHPAAVQAADVHRHVLALGGCRCLCN